MRSNSGLVTKTQYGLDKQGIEKKIEDVDKKISNTSGLVKKTGYKTKISQFEKKIPCVTGLVTAIMLNGKARKIEKKIPDTTNLATKAVLNTKVAGVESKIPGLINPTVKATLNTKVTETENKISDTTGFVTTPEFNTLTKMSFDARIEEAAKNLIIKSQVDNVLDIADKSKEKIEKFQTFYLSYFNGRRYFGNDGIQSYLIFHLIYNTFTRPTGDTETILPCKSKGFPDEVINPPSAASNSLAAKQKWVNNSKIIVEFNGSCLKQDELAICIKNMADLFIIY